MGYPSLGCVTCRKRRVKCDSQRPACSRCVRGKRECSWELKDSTDLLFKSENAFASGKPRRPRAHPGESDAEKCLVQAASTPGLSILNLPVRVEARAFHYWVNNFTEFPSYMPDMGNDYINYTLGQWSLASSSSSLHAAVSAMALAFFGRTTRENAALKQAERFYAQSIAKTMREMRLLSERCVERLMITTLLLTTYENLMYGSQRTFLQDLPRIAADEVGSRLWKSACHYEGTVGLMQLGQQRMNPYKLPLYRAVRRPIIRAHLLRGHTVPVWLRDGLVFGEEGPVLSLDSLMVRAADFRSAFLRLAGNVDVKRNGDEDDLLKILSEARQVDTALESWPESLSDEWSYATHTQPICETQPDTDDYFESKSHCFKTHGHAIVWIRYWAVRLVVSSICQRLPDVVFLQTWASEEAHQVHESNITSAITNMCFAVSFFFEYSDSLTGSVATSPESATSGILDHDQLTINPRLSTLLSWPVSVAVSTDAAPAPQRRWLRHKLKTIAMVQGDAVLLAISENEEFRF